MQAALEILVGYLWPGKRDSSCVILDSTCWVHVRGQLALRDSRAHTYPPKNRGPFGEEANSQIYIKSALGTSGSSDCTSSPGRSG